VHLTAARDCGWRAKVPGSAYQINLSTHDVSIAEKIAKRSAFSAAGCAAWKAWARGPEGSAGAASLHQPDRTFRELRRRLHRVFGNWSRRQKPGSTVTCAIVGRPRSSGVHSAHVLANAVSAMRKPGVRRRQPAGVQGSSWPPWPQRFPYVSPAHAAGGEEAAACVAAADGVSAPKKKHICNRPFRRRS